MRGSGSLTRPERPVLSTSYSGRPSIAPITLTVGVRGSGTISHEVLRVGIFRRRPPLDERVRQQVSYASQTIADAQEAAVSRSNPYGQALEANQRSDLDPVAGISLVAYAEIVKQVEATTRQPWKDELARAADVAQQRGLNADAWSQAVTEWDQRAQRNPAVASAIYSALTS